MTTRRKREKQQALKMLEFEEKLPSTIKNSEARKYIADNMTRLNTDNQISFVLNLCSGMNPTEATRDAYPNTSAGGIYGQTYDLMHHPEIREIVEILKTQVIPYKLALIANDAPDTLGNIMRNGKSEKAKVQAAKIVLDHAIGSPTQKKIIQTISWHGSFSKSELREAMRRNIEKNEVIDVDTEEES